MNVFEELKGISYYLRANKIILVILMIFVFLYLINQDFFLNNLNKELDVNLNVITKLNDKIRILSNTNVSLDRERNELLTLKNQIKNLKLQLKRGREKLPKTFMVSTLIKNISKSAPVSNFVIEKMNFGKQVKKIQGITALPIRISIVGGFNASIKFIKNIDSLKRIFVINYISIKASKKSFPDIKADIGGFIFSMRK